MKYLAVVRCPDNVPNPGRLVPKDCALGVIVWDGMRWPFGTNPPFHFSTAFYEEMCFNDRLKADSHEILRA